MKKLIFILSLFLSFPAFGQVAFMSGGYTAEDGWGPSLMDPGKGTFDSGTESWVAYGNNTIENDAGALKITYVDHPNGGYTLFRETADLTTNLTVDETYRVRFRAKTNAGSNTRIRINTAGYGNIDTNLSTSFEWYEVIFVAGDASDCAMILYGFSAGEIVWIDEWYIQEQI